MEPFFRDSWIEVYGGDCRDVLRELPDASVHCVVTSPPYWGLRDYGTATWEGGDPACEHKAAKRKTRYDYALDSSPIQQGSRTGTDAQAGMYLPVCPTCGAVREDHQLGLEPTPEEYVADMVAVFREVWRVLRDDGTAWLNLGDTFSSRGGAGGTMASAAFGAKRQQPRPEAADPERMGRWNRDWQGLKPKDLVGIPWRVAFALQDDGWYLRSDIVWAKPAPMPESVTDRPRATSTCFCWRRASATSTTSWRSASPSPPRPSSTPERRPRFGRATSMVPWLDDPLAPAASPASPADGICGPSGLSGMSPTPVRTLPCSRRRLLSRA